MTPDQRSWKQHQASEGLEQKFSNLSPADWFYILQRYAPRKLAGPWKPFANGLGRFDPQGKIVVGIAQEDIRWEIFLGSWYDLEQRNEDEDETVLPAFPLDRFEDAIHAAENILVRHCFQCVPSHLPEPNRHVSVWCPISGRNASNESRCRYRKGSLTMAAKVELSSEPSAIVEHRRDTILQTHSQRLKERKEWSWTVYIGASENSVGYAYDRQDAQKQVDALLTRRAFRWSDKRGDHDDGAECRRASRKGLST